MSSESDPRDARDDRMVDWLLGELSEADARALAKETTADVGALQSAAELRCLFEDLRQLTVPVRPHVGVAVRYEIKRRLALRQEPAEGRRSATLYCLRVAAVAAVAFAAMVIGHRLWRGVTDRAASAPVIAETPLPRVLDRPGPAMGDVPAPTRTPVPALLLATNDLARLRREFKHRFDAGLRHRAIMAAGGSTHLEARIALLADDIAAKVQASIAARTASVQDVAMSLRALLAAGSTKRMGVHQAAVRTCSDHLEARVAELSGGELATALSGLMDVAVVYGGRLARLVKVHTERMIEPMQEPDADHRPDLLHWRTPIAQLADAGQVLRQAPAFGVDPSAAIRARSFIRGHVAERIAMRTDERPDLFAAYLYGFGELLVDRERTERRLRLWRARDLVSEYYVALHHMSWSRFPLQSGWADFQRELRRVSAVKTPKSVTDVSALLLCLAVNFAAPGCQELVDIVAAR